MMRSHYNVGMSVLFCIAHMYEPPMAQFDGIAINIWKNRKVNSDVNIMCQKPQMGQFDGIIKNIWKNRKVHSDEKLYVLNFT